MLSEGQVVEVEMDMTAERFKMFQEHHVAEEALRRAAVESVVEAQEWIGSDVAKLCGQYVSAEGDPGRERKRRRL